jgi:putative ABC transport system permease protein
VLAVAIGCVGLYGLAAFNTARRLKEIGIRKTLGTSTSEILKLLLGQILRPVLIANLVAWPLAATVVVLGLGLERLVPPANLALIFVLPVVVAATTFGFGPALGAVAASPVFSFVGGLSAVAGRF